MQIYNPCVHEYLNTFSKHWIYLQFCRLNILLLSNSDVNFSVGLLLVGKHQQTFQKSATLKTYGGEVARAPLIFHQAVPEWEPKWQLGAHGNKLIPRYMFQYIYKERTYLKRNSNTFKVILDLVFSVDLLQTNWLKIRTFFKPGASQKDVLRVGKWSVQRFQTTWAWLRLTEWHRDISFISRDACWTTLTTIPATPRC